MSSPTLKLMESAMKRNVLQKINEVGHQKDYLKHTHTIKTVIARGSDGHLQEIYLGTFFGNHVRR